MRHPAPLLALALAALALLAPLEKPETGPLPVAAAASGRLLLPRSSGLSLFDLADGSERPLYTSRQVVMGAAWSPDGGRVAFAQFSKAPGDRYSSADLYLLEAGQAAPVVTHAGPDQVLSNPLWTPDGRALIYQVSGGTSAGFSVELAALDGSDHRTLESQAGSPALSPDGRLLAVVRVTNTDALLVRPLSGGEAREVLPPDAFLAIYSPRFSPDGQKLAFLGIGGPPGGRLPRPTSPASARSPVETVLASLQPGPAAALAHGIPWDPWVVNLDGSGLRQVANLAEDDPTVAWSPDGSTLAVLGGGGLWLVPADGRGDPTLLAYGSYGLLDWRS